MGATYTRQSSYTDGDVITAADTNNEFDQLLAVFAASTGHTHDGTAAEGGPITKLLGTSITIGDATSGTDITVTFDGESNDGVLKWMEDEDYFEFSDDILVASTEKIQFRDTAIYINSSADGQLDLVADTEIQIAATTVDINGNVDVSGTLTVAGAVDFGDAALSNVGAVQLDSIAGDGDTNTSITFSGSDVITIANAGTNQVTFNDGSIVPVTDSDVDLGTTSLRFKDVYIDSATVTGQVAAASLDISGDIDVDGTTNLDVVDIDGAVDMATTLAVAGNVDFNGDLDVDGTANLDVVDIDGAVDMASTLQVDGVATFTGRDIHSGGITIANAGQIGSVGDTDAIAIASDGVVTLTQKLVGTELDISGNVDVDGTTNLDVVDIDGAVDMATTLAVAGNVDFNGDLDVDGTTNLDNTDIDGTLVVDGSNISLDSTSTLNIDNSNTTNGITIGTATSGVPVSIGHTTSETTVNDNLTVTGSTTLAATSFGDADITNVGDIALDSISADGTDINIAVTDNSATALTIKQGSDAYLIVDTANSSESVSIGTGISGTAITIGHGTSETTFGDNVTVTGDFTVNGTTTTVATTNLTVTDPLVKYGQGYTGTAYDQGFIITRGDGSSSNTANRGFIWDESADEFATIAANTEAGTTAGNVTINDYAPLHVGAITADDNSTFSGEIAAASLDISGDIDVDGTTNLDVVDIDGAVDMASTLQVDGAITSSTGATITTADNTDTLQLVSTDADANIGPNLRLYRNSSSPADSDTIGVIDFEGRNDNSQDIIAARINVLVDDVSDGTEDATLFINTMLAGAVSSRIKMTPTETTLNDDSKDLDFRVETDGVTDALFVDGGNNNVQIGTGADFVTNTAGTSNFRAGVNAGNSIESGGNYNVAVGDEAGTAITTGDGNVAIGFEAGNDITTGSYNTIMGWKAGDKISTGGSNTAIGDGAIGADTLGQKSVAIGSNTLNAQNFTTATDTYNTAMGWNAGAAVTTGVGNTLIGGVAGDALTDADDNVAIGQGALTNDTLGSKSVAIGRSALDAQNFTTATDTYNTAVGYHAGVSVTTGVQNTFVGGLAGDALTDADKNVAVGYAALSSDTLGSHSVAIGRAALNVQNFTTATNVYNTAVGSNAGAAVTTGDQNTLIGASAGDALTVGNNNVAVGYEALSGDTKGDRNVAIGRAALQAQNFTTSTDSYNVAIGYGSGETITTGINNTLIGGLAGDALNTGNRNTVVGESALSTDTKGARNVAIGNAALNAQNFTTATNSYNVAVGYAAGIAITTGIRNNLFGAEAGDALTDADDNIAIGYQTLTADTLGSRSVAIGNNALDAQNFTTATNTYNTAVGYAAGGAVTTGLRNVLIGGLTGDALTDADDNTALGMDALSADTLGSKSVAIGKGALNVQNFTTATDSFNTAVGYNAGSTVTTGDKSVCLGAGAGANEGGSITLVDGDNNVCIGYYAHPHASDGGSEIVMGKGTLGHADSTFTFGKNAGSDRVHNTFTSNATFTRVSDERYKKDIQTNTDCGLDFINELRTVTFKFKAKSEIPNTLPDYDAEKTTAEHTDKLYGLIAQEVKAALAKHNITDFGGHSEEESSGIQGVAQSMFIYPLIKSVQELSTALDAALARIATLEG